MTGMTPGHRLLSDEERELVADIREAGQHLEILFKKLASANADGRWLSIARTHMQQGSMAAVRAVTKPEFF